MERCLQELRDKIDYVIEVRDKRRPPDVKLRSQLARNLSAWSRANRVNAVADLPVTFSMSEVTAAQRFCFVTRV